MKKYVIASLVVLALLVVNSSSKAGICAGCVGNSFVPVQQFSTVQTFQFAPVQRVQTFQFAPVHSFQSFQFVPQNVIINQRFRSRGRRGCR